MCLCLCFSRLYVVRQPVNREDACKPIVMPDGRTVYRCSYCNKDFCTFSDVNRHMDFHEGRQPGPNSAAGRWEGTWEEESICQSL